MRSSTALLSVFVLATTACATNGHHEFYTDLLKGQPITSVAYLIPYEGNPEVYSSSDPQNDSLAMLENGFDLIGYSNFNGPMNSANDPAAQARLVHAAVVLVNGKFSHSVTGSMPYTVYTPGNYITSTSRGSIYGTGGSATYTGSTSTYVPATSTTYETHYQIDRYDQSASFWVRIKRPRLGIIPRDLTPEERQQYQRNRGVVARAIVKGSPAFLGDLLRGDVIIRIGDDLVIDAPSYSALLDKYEGREVPVTYIRSGLEMTKSITLNRSH